MNYRFLLAGVVVVGMVFAAYLVSQSKKNQQATSKSVSVTQNVMKNSNESATVQDRGTLVVQDQPAGTQVTIKLATLDNPGFVMLLKADMDGNPTDMIGVSNVITGTKADITIPIMGNLKSGDTVFAMLHTDANKNSIFEWPGVDSPILDSNGETIMKSFLLN